MEFPDQEAWTLAAAGVHLFHVGGLLSMKHTAEDIDKTVEGFKRTVLRMQEQGMFEG